MELSIVLLKSVEFCGTKNKDDVQKKMFEILSLSIKDVKKEGNKVVNLAKHVQIASCLL